MTSRHGKALFILIVYFSATINNIHGQEDKLLIANDDKKMDCLKLQNAIYIHVQNLGLQDLNECICKQGYQWSSIYLECRSSNDQSMIVSNRLYFQDSMINNFPRILTVNCDFTNGFILKNNQCLNCRVINNSTGIAQNSTSCGCVWPYFWSIQYLICGCYSLSTPAYLNGGQCVFCSSITNSKIQIDCNNCFGSSFAYSKFGCLNCTSIQNGDHAEIINGLQSCICKAGYSYSYLLGTCVCSQFWAQTGQNCSQCSLLSSSELINECLNCAKSFFFNGYYCELSSNVLNFDPAAKTCVNGYAFSVDPINNINRCTCSASNYFTNGSSCISCINMSRINNSLFQACKICNQSQGFFSQASKCVYCVSIQFSTGIATANGCSCRSNYFWNLLTSQCQCDWTKGYFQIGNYCISCYDISYTTISNNSNSCNCIQGFFWNMYTNVCQCLEEGNFLLSTVQGCINCHIISGSNGNSINASSCQCQNGFIWDNIQISCICDINQNHYLASNGDCLYCQYLPNCNGFASDSGCNCLNGFIYIHNYGGCVCPNSYGAGYVNMGHSCQKCSVAISSLSRTSLSGCINCSVVEGFALSNEICYACSQQKLALGTASVINGCDCINITMAWFPAFGGCVCNIGYYTYIVNGSFICWACSDNCSCGNNNTANVSGICIICSSVPFSTGNAINNSCICQSGYSWDIKSFPFKCYCSSRAGSYLNGSSCYNCTNFSAYSSITSNGCINCDPSQGFLYLPVADQCILCISMPGSDGTSRISGCGCLNGIWNSNKLLCQSFACNISSCSLCKTNFTCYSCTKGYILSVDSSLCTVNCFIAYCDVCSSSQSCSSCITGYQTSTNYTICFKVSCFANCAICQSNNSCLSCLNRYFLSADKTYCTIICNVLNCEMCSSSVTCSQCLMGFYLTISGRQCILICNDYNCLSCPINSSYCSSCATGLFLTNGKCIRNTCINNCNICFNNITCLQCNAGYYFKSSLSNMSICAPLCSITNCSQCYSMEICFICDTGYQLIDNRICKLQCNISNCDICLTAIACSICLQGYFLNYNYCILECSLGYYNSDNKSNINCTSCTTVNYTCSTCQYVNSLVTCVSCPDNYFLDQTKNVCTLCNFNNSNCQICISITHCTSCIFPYNLNQNGNCDKINCHVPNCIACSNSSNFTCEICANGLIYNDSTNKCDFHCAIGFIFYGPNCNCPLSTQLNNTNCIACSDRHCLSCNIEGCLICFTGYYLNDKLSCVACPYNCADCISTICMECYNGFSLLNDGSCYSIAQGINSIEINTNFIACYVGCSKCSINVSNYMNCVKLQNGYILSSGVSVKCNNELCKQCAKNSLKCLSCFNGYLLLNSRCLTCSDPKALLCLSNHINQSILCAPGFTAAASISFSGGLCLPCSEYCLKCDINGPNYCDPFSCMLGFAQIFGTTNCTACFKSCPICDPSNINICSDCGPYRFKNSQSQCLPCQLGCLACNSEIFCIACIQGYSLLNNICFLNLNYPCAKIDYNSQCKACFQGYILNSSTCLIDLTCNGNNSCIQCPEKYFLLNSLCLKCPILPNHCISCDSLENKCTKCQKGYYISDYVCRPCQSNCRDCYLSTFCKQAAVSFYLQINYDGSNSGRVNACNTPCLTCAFNSYYCLSCLNGYTISGSTCVSNFKFIIQLVLGSLQNQTIFNISDSSQSQLTKMLNNVNWLAHSFCNILPNSLKANVSNCKRLFRFISFTTGSIIINAEVNAKRMNNVNDIKSEISTNLNQIGIGGVSVISFSITFFPSVNIDDPSSKQFIILAVCIISGVAFIIVIGLIIFIAQKHKTAQKTPQTPTSQQDVKSSRSDKDNFWDDKKLHSLRSNGTLSQRVTKRTHLKKQDIQIQQKQEEYIIDDL